ncbi:MAG TPA: TonB-dependent receptor, partial [Aquabacterium sp.]|nr:TonB-dependent receptor [Aquabacterium sp.]
LRLVPGMAVMRSTAHDYKINYHGTNTSQPRRLNVLVDGISVYKPGLSRVDWASLPVSIEDIDRIEVTRGSNSSAYGPNSMMAIINILTRHPKDVDRGLVALSADSRDDTRTTLRMAGALGAWHVRATYEQQGSTGYDYSTRGGADHDGITTERLNLRSQVDLAGGSSLETHWSLGRALRQYGRLDPFQTSPQNLRDTDVLAGARLITPLSPDHELQFTLSANETRIRQRWSTCWPQLALLPEVYALSQANPDYILQMLRGQIPPTGGSARDDELAQIAIQAILGLGSGMFMPICGMTDNNADESRVQLEVQDTYVMSDRLRLVGGLGARHQRTSSQTFLAGTATNNLIWVFGHGEFRPSNVLTVNMGGYFESNSLSGDTFSPRLALNWHLPKQQTLRLVYSEGTRTPDLFEERARWSQTLYNIDPPLNGSSTAKIAA